MTQIQAFLDLKIFVVVIYRDFAILNTIFDTYMMNFDVLSQQEFHSIKCNEFNSLLCGIDVIIFNFIVMGTL